MVGLDTGAWREIAEKASLRLNQHELRDLTSELESLTKQQSNARIGEIFIGMTQTEIEAFDRRKARISQIYIILSNHDAKR